MQEVQNLIEISHFFGQKKEYVIAGGGNTSFKNNNHIWVKASGTNLANITEGGFAQLNRAFLAEIDLLAFSTDTNIREHELNRRLLLACTNPDSELKPSVDSLLHNAFEYSYVVHTHPTIVNAVTCSNNAKQVITELFGNQVLYIEYVNPDFEIYKTLTEKLFENKQQTGNNTQIVMLQNHGIFVAANTIAEVYELYQTVYNKIECKIKPITVEPLVTINIINQIVPALRMLASGNEIKIASVRNNSLIQKYAANLTEFSKCNTSLTPDQILYNKAQMLYIENTQTPESCIAEFTQKFNNCQQQYGYQPKLIVLKNIGAVAIDSNYVATQNILDIFNDALLVTELANNFGGIHPLQAQQIKFVENWKAKGSNTHCHNHKHTPNHVKNKVIIVTGAAQGFGAGIAEQLFNQNANIVIADLNTEKGCEMETNLNALGQKNGALFVKTDVSDQNSIKNLISETIKTFGGLDVFISNAGILRAGGLDELSLETFELMTKINYTAYFICTKYASEVMKLQYKYNNNHFMDIVQINSKSGLKGSNKNFAYAGGKFGGIGLTQSFALELVPFNIKVNSICPGNFFEGPLWNDPEKGLFVQYLNAGKVAGAKTIADVKKFYEAQVPMKRGCWVTDVVKAITYVMQQNYETGQAIPVTGGQNMLN